VKFISSCPEKYNKNHKALRNTCFIAVISSFFAFCLPAGFAKKRNPAA